MQFSTKTLFVVTAIVGFVLHLVQCFFGRPYADVAISLLLFYIGIGIAIGTTTIAIMTLGSRGAIVGSLLGALAWGTMIWQVCLFEPSFNRYAAGHVAIFILASGWLTLSSWNETEELT